MPVSHDSKPPDLDPARVRELIAATLGLIEPGARVAQVGSVLLGEPYRIEPLGGSPSTAERLSVDLEHGFDCVTYMEYALAIAWSRNPGDFVRFVQAIRYRRSSVSWRDRNHYLTEWIRNNQDAGFVRDLTAGRGLVERRRRLDVVAGIPVRSVRVRAIAKRFFLRRSDEVRSGDLVFFGSTRPNLDIFHCGLLKADGDRVHLLHAARSRGQVVEQSLDSFLASNRMSGVLLVRPLGSEPN